jgi:hypothetical protein
VQQVVVLFINFNFYICGFCHKTSDSLLFYKNLVPFLTLSLLRQLVTLLWQKFSMVNLLVKRSLEFSFIANFPLCNKIYINGLTFKNGQTNVLQWTVRASVRIIYWRERWTSPSTNSWQQEGLLLKWQSNCTLVMVVPVKSSTTDFTSISLCKLGSKTAYIIP